MRLKAPMAKLCLYALVCIGAFLTVNVSANDRNSAEQWIEKMNMAAIDTAYRGTFIFSRGDVSSSMRIVHRFHNGEEQERLTQIDGEMGEILRRGGEVLCILPDNRLIELDKGDFDNPIKSTFANFMPGHRYYNLSVVGYERLVERSTVIISISAKDTLRYSYRLWLDEQTGLLLKSEMLDQHAKMLERFQLTALELPADITDKDFEYEKTEVVKHNTVPMSAVDSAWPAALKWDAQWAPDGFMVMRDQKKQPANVMLYSDGIASYSVFIEKETIDTMPEGSSMVGGTVAFSTKLANGEHAYNVTVVGEIPPMTAMKVAKSIQPYMP